MAGVPNREIKGCGRNLWMVVLRFQLKALCVAFEVLALAVLGVLCLPFVVCFYAIACENQRSLKYPVSWRTSSGSSTVMQEKICVEERGFRSLRITRL